MRSLYLSCFALFLLVYPAYADLSHEEMAQMWITANKLFKQAKSEDDYLQAAQHFETIVRLGVKNGRLFYNLGNAYLKGNQLGYAILNYRRAQLYIADDPYLLENLKYARSLVEEKVQFATPKQKHWQYIFFWHFTFSYDMRLAIFLFFYICLWVLLTLRLLRISVPFWSLLVLMILVLIAIGGSLLFTNYENATKPAAVLVGEKIEIRKGGAESYGPLYQKKVKGGIEVYIIEERRDWKRIELPDGLHGWVRSHSVKKVVI